MLQGHRIDAQNVISLYEVKTYVHGVINSSVLWYENWRFAIFAASSGQHSILISKSAI
jgi:hypothetical protein